jgi:hypothetical protein
MTRFLNLVWTTLVVRTIAGKSHLGEVRTRYRDCVKPQELEKKIAEAEKKAENDLVPEYERHKGKYFADLDGEVAALEEDLKDEKLKDSEKKNKGHELAELEKKRRYFPKSAGELTEILKEGRRHWTIANYTLDDLDPHVCTEEKEEWCDEWRSLKDGKALPKREIAAELIEDLAPVGTYTCSRKHVERWTETSLGKKYAYGEAQDYGELKITKEVNVVDAKVARELKDVWDFADLSGLKWEEWDEHEAKMKAVKFNETQRSFKGRLIWDSRRSEFFGEHPDDLEKVGGEFFGLVCVPKKSPEKSPEDSPKDSPKESSKTSKDKDTADLCWLWILLGCLGGALVVGVVVYFVVLRKIEEDGELVSDVHDSEISDMDPISEDQVHDQVDGNANSNQCQFY